MIDPTQDRPDRRDLQDPYAAFTPYSPVTPPPPAARAGARPAPASRVLAFARCHPALTLIGTAGVGLLGGFEIAAGVLLGAGVAALVRGGRPATADDARAPAGVACTPVGRVLPEVKRRARAVVRAVRGRSAPAAR